MVKKTDTNSDMPQQASTISDIDLGDAIASAVDAQNTAPDAASADAVQSDDAAQPDDVTSEASALETVMAERDALKDQLLRALADTENMRRRSEREAETARKYGHTQFARDLVGAIDNLARALTSAPADKTGLDEAVQSLLTGIELSWTEIQTAIEKHGVRQINPLGEKFDYNFHQAMFEVPTNDQPAGMVLEVVQHGYALHDRLLRPAMVGVSKAADTNDAAPAKD
jgi:molecular chaperone GrpE